MWRVSGPALALIFLGTWTRAEEDSRQPSSTRKNAKTSSSLQRGTARQVGDLVNVRSSDLRKTQTQLPAFSQSLFSRPSSTASAVDLSRVKPPSSQQFFRGNTNQAELERATNQQIDELFKLTQRFKDSPRRGELWLRLAELYVEKASLIQMRLQEDYDQQIREYIGKKSTRKPKLNLESALAYNRRAIQLYEWFVRDFPKDPKIDQALFFLGYNHYELNNTRKGTEFYTRLVRDFPKSSYVVESHFALAEYYFENEKWRQAHENYAKVVQSPGHRLSLFSLYKSAWSSYRSGENTRALKEMERALRGLRSGEDKNRLEAEAVRDLTLIYAEVGRPSSAISYLREWAGEKSEVAIERLAYVYADRGNSEGARQLFGYLIQRDPTHEKAFEYKYQMVRTFASAVNTQDFKAEFLSWIRDFSEGSRWYQANASNRSLIESAESLRESTLRNWTLQQHQAAQKTKAPSAQLLAAEGYALYLGYFKKSQQLGDMHFYYGEILYDLAKFDESSLQYRWVVENAPQSRFANKAAENVVLALEKTLPRDEEIARRVGKSLDPVSFPKEAQNFVSTALWFSAKFPQHPKNLEILFRLGRLHYQHNQFEAAIPYFQQVIQRDPKSKPAEFSANLLLDIYNLKKDYAGLEKVGSELLQIPAFRGTKAAQEIQDILSKAKFKGLQAQEGQTDVTALAEKYEDFGRKNLQSSVGTLALFNAAISYQKAGRPERSLELHELVLKTSAEPKIQSQSRRIVAQLYQDSGQIDSAAAAYVRAARGETNPEVAANLHYNAALLYQALRQFPEALAQYEAFFKKSKGADRSEALWQSALIHKENKQLAKASEALKNYLGFPRLSAERRIEAHFEISEIAAKLGKTSEAEKERRQVLQLQKAAAPQRRGVGAGFAARIRLQEIRRQEQEFRSLRIPKEASKQARVVQEKIARMNKLNDELAEVIRFDSPDEIVGALQILASVNHQMAQALLQAPPPGGLSSEELAQYRAGVAQVAEPFSKKALESVQRGLERARELEVYGPEYRELLRLARQIQPELGEERIERVFDSNYVHWMGL